jgi:hypothetical protein
MTITNRSKKPRPLYVEPEGGDFWMLPEQTFELRADVTADGANFELVDDGTALQVFPSKDMGGISVLSEGREIKCGHQRPSLL